MNCLSVCVFQEVKLCTDRRRYREFIFFNYFNPWICKESCTRTVLSNLLRNNAIFKIVIFFFKFKWGRGIDWRGGCSQGSGIATRVLEGSQNFGGIPGFWNKILNWKLKKGLCLTFFNFFNLVLFEHLQEEKIWNFSLTSLCGDDTVFDLAKNRIKHSKHCN